MSEDIELVMRALCKLMERAPSKEAYDWIKEEVFELFSEDYLPAWTEPEEEEFEEFEKGEKQ